MFPESLELNVKEVSSCQCNILWKQNKTRFNNGKCQNVMTLYRSPENTGYAHVKALSGETQFNSLLMSVTFFLLTWLQSWLHLRVLSSCHELPFQENRSGLKQRYFVSYLFSKILLLNLLWLTFNYLLICVCACLCVECIHASVCGSHRSMLMTLHLIETRPPVDSHWTWYSLIFLDYLLSKPQGSSCLSPVLGL